MQIRISNISFVILYPLPRCTILLNVNKSEKKIEETNSMLIISINLSKSLNLKMEVFQKIFSLLKNIHDVESNVQ